MVSFGNVELFGCRVFCSAEVEFWRHMEIRNSGS